MRKALILFLNVIGDNPLITLATIAIVVGVVTNDSERFTTS